MAVTVAKYTTPDGVERELRCSQAAQFRMSLEKDKNGAVPEYFICWAMLFDEDDNPPLFTSGPREGKPMTAGWLGANLSLMDLPKMRAAIAEATTGAVLEKKIVELMEKLATDEIQKLAGSITGLSLETASILAEVPPVQNGSSANSGGSHPENSTPSNDATPSESETPISAPV